MKKTRWMKAALPLALAALLLAGCGQAAPAATELPAAEEVPATAAPIEEAVPATEAPAAEAPAAPEEAQDAAEPVMPEGGEGATLPAYVYRWGEPYLAAVCAYTTDVLGSGYETPRPGVCIPCPVVLEVDDSDPEDVLVWGNFWVFNYALRGTTLVCESGGENPGLLHLRPAAGGEYEVADFDAVGDGAQYAEDAQRIFGARDGLLEKFYASGDERETVRAIYISDYVNWNGLNITQYQDFGWAPVAVPGTPETTEAQQQVYYASPLGYSIRYDLRELSLSASADGDLFGGVGDLAGILLTAEKRAEQSETELRAELERDMESPVWEEAALGADGVAASRLSDSAGKAYYLVPLADGAFLVLYTSGTYYNVPGGGAVEGADAVLARTLDTFALMD